MNTKIILNPGDCVQCHDGNVYDISHSIEPDGLLVAVNPQGSQRLFKRNGQYAGADRSKNVNKVIG